MKSFSVSSLSQLIALHLLLLLMLIIDNATQNNIIPVFIVLIVVNKSFCTFIGLIFFDTIESVKINYA